MRTKGKSAPHMETHSNTSHYEQYKPILDVLSSDSQNKKVLLYMIRHGSITQDEAIKVMNCYRLASRIHDLRDLNVNITTLRVENLYNSGTHAKYLLEDAS